LGGQPKEYVQIIGKNERFFTLILTFRGNISPMIEKNRTIQMLLIIGALCLAALLMLSLSFDLLPPPPQPATPTWPQGITLPDKLPRIP
jgi:hypothetical protein